MCSATVSGGPGIVSTTTTVSVTVLMLVTVLVQADRRARPAQRVIRILFIPLNLQKITPTFAYLFKRDNDIWDAYLKSGKPPCSRGGTEWPSSSRGSERKSPSPSRPGEAIRP